MNRTQRDYPRIRELMEAICRVQQMRSDEWSRIKSQALSALPKTRQANSEANRVAYSATTERADALVRLLQTLFEDVLQLKDEEILEGEPSSFQRLMAFLSVDLLAFRCGYEKEHYLRILKRARLSPNQQIELQALGLSQCHTPGFRREFVELSRLMIRLADTQFVSALSDLASSTDLSTRRKSEFMLARILNSRTDLRSAPNA